MSEPTAGEQNDCGAAPAPSLIPTYRVAMLLLVAACGGGADHATSPGSTPVAPTTPSTVTSPGVVYVRNDTTAYLPDALPASGFAGAQVTLEASASTSSATGAFSVAGASGVSRNFEPLQASAAGWMTTWFPWYSAEAVKQIPLALYPEATVTPRPGFLKGAYYWDGGGLVAGFMRNGWTATTADRVRTVMNGNIMGALDELDVVADTAANTVTMRRVASAFTPATLQAFVNEAHSRGMKFIFELEINGNTTSALGAVPASKTAFWDSYFAAWTPLLVQTTTMARDAGVDYFIIDGLKNYLSHLPIARMQTLMTTLRATGFKGQLGYQGTLQASGGNGGNELASATPGFIDLFDFVSVYVASVVIPAPGEKLGRAYSRTRIRTDVQTFVNTAAGWPRPTIINGAIPSVHGGVSNTEYIEPCVCAGSIAPQRTRDYQQQADFYEAMAEAVNTSPAGKIIGLMSFGYMWGGDMTEDPNGPNSYYFDKSASVRGKPAEAVLSWWFKRW